LIQNERLKADYIYLSWLARCCKFSFMLVVIGLAYLLYLPYLTYAIFSQEDKLGNLTYTQKLLLCLELSYLILVNFITTS